MGRRRGLLPRGAGRLREGIREGGSASRRGWHSTIFVPTNASVQWQPGDLTIHTKKWFSGPGFLGAPPISLQVGRRSMVPAMAVNAVVLLLLVPLLLSLSLLFLLLLLSLSLLLGLLPRARGRAGQARRDGDNNDNNDNNNDNSDNNNNNDNNDEWLAISH